MAVVALILGGATEAASFNSPPLQLSAPPATATAPLYQTAARYTTATTLTPGTTGMTAACWSGTLQRRDTGAAADIPFSQQATLYGAIHAGVTLGAAGTCGLYVYGSSLILNCYSSAGVLAQSSTLGNVLTRHLHQVGFCVANGYPAILVDGSDATFARSTMTAWTAPATFTAGGFPSTYSLYSTDSISNPCVSQAKAGSAGLAAALTAIQAGCSERTALTNYVSEVGGCTAHHAAYAACAIGESNLSVDGADNINTVDALQCRIGSWEAVINVAVSGSRMACDVAQCVREQFATCRGFAADAGLPVKHVVINAGLADFLLDGQDAGPVYAALDNYLTYYVRDAGFWGGTAPLPIVVLVEPFVPAGGTPAMVASADAYNNLVREAGDAGTPFYVVDVPRILSDGGTTTDAGMYAGCSYDNIHWAQLCIQNMGAEIGKGFGCCQ